MNRFAKFFAHSATAAAASLLVAACGGGDASPPPGASAINAPSTAPGPDTAAPTVAIFDDTPAATASGPVTFSFVFSEDVGASFTADDVTVTGGTAGAFTKVSGTQATLVVTPTANSAGTMSISIAAGSFSDGAGNRSAAAASAQKAFSSVVLTQMALPVSFDLGGIGYGLAGFGGAEDSSIAADPTNAANQVGRVVRAAGAEVFAGTTITATTAAGVQTGLAPRIPFTASDTTMTLRVWSPDAGIPVRLKVEDSGDPNKSVETEATVTTAAGWQTLSFNFASQVAGTAALNLAFNYNKPTVFFDFGRARAAAVQKTYYFDDLAFGAAAPAAGCGTSAPTCAPTTAIPAGATVIYSDAAAIGGLIKNPDWGQSPAVGFAEPVIAGNTSLRYSFGGTALYEGIDWAASPVDVSSKTRLHLDVFPGDVTSLKVSIISAGKENAVTQALTAGSWNAIDIDLAQYTVPDKTAIIQIKLEPNVAGTIHVDNIYFHGAAAGGTSCGTTAPTCAPTTAIAAGSTVIYSDAASVAGIIKNPDWGQSPAVVFAEPVIAGNTSLKYTFGGTALYEGIDWAGSPQNVAAKGTLHLDVWTADVASLKVSLIGGGAENAISKALTAGRWTAIDIDLSQYTSPDLTRIIQMKLEPNVAGTIYVDNIHFTGTAAGGGVAPGSFTGGIFASDYSGNLGANTARSDKGGTVGFFVDPRLFAVKVFEDGSVSGSAQDPAGVHNFFYGIGKPASPTFADAFFGAFVNAPGDTTADASAFAKVKLKFWGDAESWEKPNFTAQVDVLLQGPANVACTNPSGRPEITKTVAAQKIGAGADYLIAKTEFTLTQSCGGAYTVNSIWSAVGAVVVRLSGANLNYVNTVPSVPPSYPTFINMGPISFIN
ncbi:exported hypothetical protein [Rubrivivax sp. A210]|uniref:Ig-like domain-containing protein n=1 Tax=Rubrivivax sp. A210 TaxID=2772301 RepID=UPI00191A52AA|nr:Ig-like domain-containing protein [Rubrivivax sp. A210]CAD5372779.1 exported hypothetical protein [Rubrivivax sp. A210]